MSERPFRPVDFTAGAFIVRRDRGEAQVLLVDHKKFDRWLCPGGHIEEGEQPEEACLREVKEETGLEIELVGERPPITYEKAQALIAPRYMDIHDVMPGHRHVGMMYFAKYKGGEATLEAAAHDDLRWFNREEVYHSDRIAQNIRWYALKALEEVK